MLGPDKPARLLPLLPGDSKPDPLLQREAMMQFYQGMTAKVRDCKQITVVQTKFEDWEGEVVKNALHGPNARPWRETWTAWACGKLLDVPIHFLPDATGTTTTVHLKEVSERP